MSTQLRYENPSARIRQFWADFRIKSGPAVAASRLRTNRQVLATLTGISANDNAGLIEFVGIMMKTPAQIRKGLAESGYDLAPFDRAISRLESLLGNLNLDGNAQQLRSEIDASLMESLDMISAILQKHGSGYLLTNEQRTELLQKIDELQANITEAELDGDFEKFATDRLQSLRYAIQQYQFLGVDEIIENVDKLFGGLVRQSPTITHSPAKKGVVKKMLGLAASVLIMIQLANGGFELAASLHQLLNAINAQPEVDPGMPSALPEPTMIADTSNGHPSKS